MVRAIRKNPSYKIIKSKKVRPSSKIVDRIGREHFRWVWRSMGLRDKVLARDRSDEGIIPGCGETMKWTEDSSSVDDLERIEFEERSGRRKKTLAITREMSDKREVIPMLKLEHLGVVPRIFGFTISGETGWQVPGYGVKHTIKTEFQYGPTLSDHIFEKEDELRSVVKHLSKANFFYFLQSGGKMINFNLSDVFMKKGKPPVIDSLIEEWKPTPHGEVSGKLLRSFRNLKVSDTLKHKSIGIILEAIKEGMAEGQKEHERIEKEGYPPHVPGMIKYVEDVEADNPY